MLVRNPRMFPALAVLACFLSVEAAAQTTLPRVRATLVTLDGGMITCNGSICVDALRSIETMIMMEGEFAQVEQEDVKVDKQKFCAYLKMAQPPGCSLTSPPSAPGYDPGFMGNGCGDGSFASWIANEVVSNGVWGYEGNLDHPLPGVSFNAACQVHDYCYAAGGVKDSCDHQFGTALQGVCAGTIETYQTSCYTLSSIYKKSVSLLGSSAYNGAQADLACAAWAYDMEANECED